MDYGIVAAGDSGIVGGITTADTAGTVVYLQIDDIQATLDRIERAGGKTVVPRDRDPRHGHVRPVRRPRGQRRRPDGELTGHSQSRRRNSTYRPSEMAKMTTVE